MKSYQDNQTGKQNLTLIFDVSIPEQLEAIHYWRAAFAEAAEIEPVVEDKIWALHISPGGVREMVR